MQSNKRSLVWGKWAQEVYLWIPRQQISRHCKMKCRTSATNGPPCWLRPRKRLKLWRSQLSFITKTNGNGKGNPCKMRGHKMIQVKRMQKRNSNTMHFWLLWTESLVNWEEGSRLQQKCDWKSLSTPPIWRPGGILLECLGPKCGARPLTIICIIKFWVVFFPS